MKEDAAADIDLAQRCLEGDESAVETLQRETHPWLHVCLRSAGASDPEAEELLSTLWSDCICGTGERDPRLSRYRGQCSLRGWLKTVAINQLIDLKRRDSRWQQIAAELRDESEEVALVEAEAPVVEILKRALTSALERSPSESLVMLQLVYVNGLTQREIARMWGWHESKVSRTLAAAADELARTTLETVRQRDPWLTLTWEDFVELCRCADFSVFV